MSNEMICKKDGCENERHMTKSGNLRPYCGRCESEASKRSRAKRLAKTSAPKVSETMMVESKLTLDEILTSLVTSTKNKLQYLFDRWNDESEFEDWSDYQVALEKMVEAHKSVGVEFVKTSKRPFGIQMDIQGYRFLYACTSTKIYVKELVVAK